MFPSQVAGAILFVVIILPFYSFTLIKDTGLKEAPENLLRCSNSKFCANPAQKQDLKLLPYITIFKILMVFKKKQPAGLSSIPLVPKVKFLWFK